MSSLTEQERLGLEEVFLSISPAEDREDAMRRIKGRIKHLSTLKIFGASAKSPLYKAVASIGRIRITKLSHFLKVSKRNKREES